MNQSCQLVGRGCLSHKHNSTVKRKVSEERPGVAEKSEGEKTFAAAIFQNTV